MMSQACELRLAADGEYRLVVATERQSPVIGPAQVEDIGHA